MPWESVLYLGILVLVLAILFVDHPGRQREDRRASRLMKRWKR